MNKQIYPLLIAQFLSAFADNAILFTVIAIVMHSTNPPAWYVPALQSSFLLSFVIFAPWVGHLADNVAKSRILIIANLIKASGAGLLWLAVDPLLAYCIVGLGAAIYSPAKYGILPELAKHDFLVKANSWIEGSTILAILLGMIIGAKVADYSTQWALAGVILLFATSALVTLSLPVQIAKKPVSGSQLADFIRQMKCFFITPRSRFAILGGSLFWAAAATLRVILVAWAPLILMAKNATEIAELTLFLAIGIIAGSAIVPNLIPLEKLRRARVPAYLMGFFMVALSFTQALWPARCALFFVGVMGGMFIVPINAVLQDQGQQSIGSGSAVALQNFFQNLAMLVAVGSYTFAASRQVDPVISLLALGAMVLVATLSISLFLPGRPK
jgi:LPLT family lysophospholipid transporter-like MFS transporter